MANIYNDLLNKEGLLHINPILNNIPVGKEKLIALMDSFEKGEIDVFGLSDDAEELHDKIIEETYEKIKDDYPDSNELTTNIVFDEESATEYSYHFEWAILSKLEWASSFDITNADILFIRKFLDIPVEKRSEAYKEWSEYWYSPVEKARRKARRQKILEESAHRKKL